MTSKPKVSIIIPTYNQADLLKECLESILEQTDHAWEAIIIDNHSSDHTKSVIARFKDKRMQYIPCQNNGIIAISRNKGVALAKAPLIAFLDSDDKWHPEKLEKVLEFFQANPNIDVLCHDEQILLDTIPGKILRYGPHTTYKDLLFKSNCLSTSAVTLRKNCLETVQGFSEGPQLAGVEDYDLWLRLAKANFNLAYLHEILGYFRIHGQSYSHKTKQHLDSNLHVLEKHLKPWKPKNFYYNLLTRRRTGLPYRSAARAYLKQKNIIDARNCLLFAIKKNPFDYKTWLLMTYLVTKMISKQ